MSIVRLLGTGTVLPSERRGGTCSWFNVDGRQALLDCGPGSRDRLARAGIRLGELSEILFTHLHLDHTLDLFGLLFYRLYPRPGDLQPLLLRGPPGFRSWLWGAGTALHPRLIEGQEMLTVEEVPLTGHFRFLGRPAQSIEARHSQPSCSYRFSLGDGIVFTGDSGLQASLIDLARGAHTLVAECASPEERPTAFHLCPSEVARLALAAGVSRLVVTHLYPEVEAALPGAWFDEVPETLVARDGLELLLAPSSSRG